MPNAIQHAAAAKHVVIGTGPLGRATAAALVEKGQSVTLVNRSGSLDHAPAGVAVVAGDLRKLVTLRAEVANAAAIYFCAQPPYHQWADQFPPLQNAAIELAKGSGARLVVAENLYGYGSTTAAMTEDTALRPNTRKGAVRADMHRTLIGYRDSGTVQVAVARGSDFFGPHVDGSAVGARAMAAVIAGRAVGYTGNLDALHSYTFVNDFGSALATLGTDDRALGQVWHVPNAPAGSSRRFFETACQIAGTNPRFRAVSVLEMRALGLFIPPLREMIEMLYQFEDTFIVDSSRFTRTFGDIATPLRESLTETINWMCLDRTR